MLAIDDSPATLSLIVDILSSQDHSVETASSGQEGLAKFEQFRPDLVTLDLVMPGLDGYETLVRLKRIDPYVNIVMLTAAEHSAALKRCLQAGALDFVSKPFTKTELANALMRVAQNKKYCDRNVSAFFALLNNRLALAIEKTFPSQDMLLKLIDVRIIKNVDLKAADAPETSDQAGDGNSTYPAQDSMCFITQASGQRECMISSYVSATILNALFDGTVIMERKMDDKIPEFFNMVNLKVVSELANAMHMQLDCKPVLLFSKPSAMTRFWNETTRMWNRIAQGTFEIDHKGNKMSFGVQIWYDGELFA